MNRSRDILQYIGETPLVSLPRIACRFRLAGPRGTFTMVGFQLDIESAHLASLRRLAEFRGRRVLEIGCGEGRLTSGIAADADSVFAFDTNATLVEMAAKLLDADVRRGRVRLSVASAVDVELPLSGFDVAVFSWSY